MEEVQTPGSGQRGDIHFSVESVWGPKGVSSDTPCSLNSLRGPMSSPARYVILTRVSVFGGTENLGDVTITKVELGPYPFLYLIGSEVCFGFLYSYVKTVIDDDR